MIHQGWITFENPIKTPNVNTNPLPNHTVNMLTFDNGEYDEKRSALKISMSDL